MIWSRYEDKASDYTQRLNLKGYYMLTSINLICFVICLICIVAGTTISILAIWGVVEKSYVVLKSLLTFGVIFLAALLTITVNKLIPINRQKKEQEKG
jgi:hypothetical protein